MRVCEFANHIVFPDVIDAPKEVVHYGVEIEAEHVRQWKETLEYLHVKEDGSLRNRGLEFYTPRPVNVGDAVAAFEEFYYCSKKWNYNHNARAGIHIHVNMLNRDMRFVRTLAALYAVLEPVLFTFAGEGREENIFCVPWYRAPKYPVALSVKAEKRGYAKFHGGLRTAEKYRAINIASLGTFGTLEFRQAATFPDRRQALDWLAVIDALVRGAGEFRQADDVIDLASTDCDALAEQVIPSRLLDQARAAMRCSVDEAADRVDSLAAASHLREAQAEVTWHTANRPLRKAAGYHRVIDGLRPRPMEGTVAIRPGRARAIRPDIVIHDDIVARPLHERPATDEQLRAAQAALQREAAQDAFRRENELGVQRPNPTTNPNRR